MQVIPVRSLFRILLPSFFYPREKVRSVQTSTLGSDFGFSISPQREQNSTTLFYNIKLLFIGLDDKEHEAKDCFRWTIKPVTFQTTDDGLFINNIVLQVKLLEGVFDFRSKGPKLCRIVASWFSSDGVFIGEATSNQCELCGRKRKRTSVET